MTSLYQSKATATWWLLRLQPLDWDCLDWLFFFIQLSDWLVDAQDSVIHHDSGPLDVIKNDCRRLTHHSFWELSTKIRHWVLECWRGATSPHQQQNVELLGPMGYKPPKLDMCHLWHLVTEWWFCCEKTSFALDKNQCEYANMPEFSAIFLLLLRISPRSRNLVPAAPVPKGAEIQKVSGCFVYWKLIQKRKVSYLFRQLISGLFQGYV